MRSRLLARTVGKFAKCVEIQALGHTTGLSWLSRAVRLDGVTKL